MKKPTKTAKHTPVKKHAPKPAAKKPQRVPVKKPAKAKSVVARAKAPKPKPVAKVKAPARAPAKKAPPAKKPAPISVKKRETPSAKPVPAPAKAPTPKAQPTAEVKKPASSKPAAGHAKETTVATALKGKLLELQKRTALKRSRATTAFAFEEAADVLGSRRGQLKLFKTQGAESSQKVLKKQDFLPKVKQRSVGAASLDDILGMAPTKKPSHAKDPDMESVPPKFRRHYKLLLDMRTRVGEGLDVRSKDTLKRSTKDDSGDLAAYGPDSGTDTFDRDFALNLVSSEQDILFEIDQAIKRLANGTYGVCEITGKPIPADRLAAVPFTRYTLEGQKELEATSQVRKTYIEPPTNLTETSEEDSPASSYAEDDGDE